MTELELAKLLQRCVRGVLPPDAPAEELVARGLAVARPGKGWVLTPSGRLAAAEATAAAKRAAAEAKASLAAAAKSAKADAAAAKRGEKARLAAEKTRVAAEARAQKAAARPRPKSTPAAQLGARVEQLEAKVDALATLVASMQARLSPNAPALAVASQAGSLLVTTPAELPAASQAPSPSVVSPAELSATLLALVRRLDATHRLDGLVPLPLLRREAAAPRASFDAALLALEREGRLQLKTTNDPSRQPDAADGLVQPGRGLLFFAVPR